MVELMNKTKTSILVELKPILAFRYEVFSEVDNEKRYFPLIFFFLAFDVFY